MLEINAKKADSEIIADITKSVHSINEARAEYNRQAFVNVMFLYGNHHFTVSRQSPNPSIGQRILWELEATKDKNTIKRTSNYILPLFRSVYSRMIRMKANVHAEPMTSTEKDRSASRVSKEVAEDFWENCNRNNIWLSDECSSMQAVLMKLILYKMTVGTGYLFPYFNPKAKSLVYDKERNDVIEAEVGEAEVRVEMPMNVFKDRFNRFVIVRRFMSPEQAEYEFDEKVEPTAIDEEATDVKIGRALDGSGMEKMDKEGAYIYTKYCVATKEYPEGRVISCSGNKILGDAEAPLPKESKGRIPCYEFKYQDLGFSRHAQGPITQVIDLQQDYNFTIARIAQHKKLLTGKIFTPKGSKLSAKWDDVVGQIISYTIGHKPTAESAPPIPAYYFEELKRIRSDMEGLMNSHDVSMGRTPGQVKSGIGIQNLAERDDAQIAPELIMFEQKLGFFAEHILDICQQRYQERRLLKISGEDLAFEVKSFIGSELFGQKRVKIRMGSNLPIDKNDRTNYILMLRKEGFISPERAKDLLEFTDVDGAFRSLDETAAKQDILNIIEGNLEVIPEPYEDHSIFLKVINDFRKGSVYMKLDQMIRERINQWADIHQEMLLAEQQAAASMGGQLPQGAEPQGNQGQ